MSLVESFPCSLTFKISSSPFFASPYPSPFFVLLRFLLLGLNEVVLVIQSQRNSYHARRGHQRKVEILLQAAEMGQVISSRNGTFIGHQSRIMERILFF